MAVKMIQENPFTDYGSIVYGKRFVGRRHELRELRQRVLPREGIGGNYAIMGLPRIGKSSLMWEGIMSQEAELLKQNIIVVWYTASKVNDTFHFLRGICKDIIGKARLLANETLTEFLNDKKIDLRDVQNKEEVKDIIEDVLKIFTLRKIKVKLLLDEFDAVQNYMTPDDFGFLRTITYEPDRKIVIVTTSRKAIKDIEAVSGSVSNWHGIFDTKRLGLFDEESLDDYWQWMKSYKPPINVNNNYISDAIFKVGAHPYLLDFYNYHHWLHAENEEKNNNGQDFDIQLNDLFDTMQETLRKDILKDTENEKKGTNKNLLDAAIQLVVGPVMDVNSDQARLLEAYDFIMKTTIDEKAELLGNHYGVRYRNGQAYSCFSAYLTTQFAYQHLFDIPYWAEWQETEVRVRGVIKKYVETLGSNWEELLLNRFGSDPNWCNNYNSLKSLRSRSLKRFPNASQNLVDYTLPANMYSMFIGPAWGDYFSNVFMSGSNRSGNRDEWRRKFQFLADVRNPVAHSNGLFIEQDEINQAKLYCKAIINAINQWEEK